MGVIADTLSLLFSEPGMWTAPLWRHIQLSLLAIVGAIAIGVPAGAWLSRNERFELIVVNVANLGRTVPSLALLALVYPFVGTGFAPSIIALVALGVPPVLLTTFTGIREVDADVRDAAAGIGLTSLQRLVQVELPVASPVVLDGIRTSATQIVASATLAALVGGGGLGELVLAGLSNMELDLLLAGAVLVALLAAATEIAFALFIRHGLPAGIRLMRSSPVAQALGYAAGGGIDAGRWRMVIAGVATGCVVLVGAGSVASGMIAGIGRVELAPSGPLPAVRVAIGGTPAQRVIAELHAQALEGQGYTVQRSPLRAARGGGRPAPGAIDLAFVPPAAVDDAARLVPLAGVAPDPAGTALVRSGFERSAGPAFASTIGAVRQLLDVRTVRVLARQAATGTAPAEVARTFLAEHGLDERGPRPVVHVGSKNFTEQIILAELYGQALEARGFPVERHLNLGGSAVVHGAVQSGYVDMYPEYTGTSWTSVLKKPTETGVTGPQLWRDVRQGYRGEGLEVLRPTPFSNGNAMAVTAATAKRYKLRTLTDLGRVANRLTIGIVPGFETREDQGPALEKVYGIRFRKLQSYDNGLKYRALMSGKVDIVQGFGTDGQIATNGLVVLEDDKRLWPPYNAAPIVNGDFAEEAGPDFDATLNHVSSLLDDATMQRLNSAVDEHGREPEDVARQFLSRRGIVSSR